MTSPADRLNSALAGKYEVLREIGAGGMATVYLAHDVKHDRDVALKVLRPELAQSLGRERFLREIQLVAKLTHPHILPLHDSGDADGMLYYVMPNVEGHSLRDRMTENRTLPIDEAVRLASEVARGLDYAHRHGVVHRDIKPENIMIQDGQVLIADFGIGKAVGSVDGHLLTQSGMSVGTPAYMSPEQAMGEEVDGRSDIYSLGCVLYEMLVGEQPFTGPTMQAVIAKRFVQTPADVSALREGIPRTVARAVQKALARTAIDRYDTAAHFVTSLGEVDAAAALEKTAAPEKSLAVLPFVNLSADAENEFFADGITEEILNALSQIPDLRVAGRASSFSFKGKNVELRMIGEQLHVRTVLEGSVRRSGTRVRITAQLSDATDGYRLWSERYDREIADVFAVQEEIATAIATRLKASLQSDRSAVAGGRTTDSIEAYEAFLKGRVLLQRRGTATKQGMALMQRALELDAGYALAWSGLAEAYHVAGYFGLLSPEQCIPPARHACERALEVAPSLPEAHLAVAQFKLLFGRDREGAERSFQRALALNLGYIQGKAWFHMFYGSFLCGRHEEALAGLLMLQSLDPLSAYMMSNTGLASSLCGKRQEAVRWAKKGCDADPAAFLSFLCLQIVCYANSQFAESVEAAEVALGLSGRSTFSLSILGAAYGELGRPDDARAILGEMRSRATLGYVSPIMRATVAAAIGETEEAVALAREGYRRRDPALVVFTRHWPPARRLASLPEVRELLAALKIPE